MLKKILLPFVLLLLLVGGSSFYAVVDEVYICKGPSSKRYHYDKNCRGLSNCSTSTYGVTLVEAKEIGRTLCGWED